VLIKIFDMNYSIKEQLRESGISKLMKSVESCDWVVTEQFNDKIIGVAFMGGLFHVSGIQLLNEFQGKGIGKKLQKELIIESKRKGYSFITMFNDPRNKPSENLHNSLGYKLLFRIHFCPDVIQDIKAITFNLKGDVVIGFLRIFNTKLGMLFLGLVLKTFRFAFTKTINHNENNTPKANLRWILKNFEKV